MKNSKENDEKDADVEVKSSKIDIESRKKEREIQKRINSLEEKTRKGLEEILEIQKREYEAALCGERLIIKSGNKNYKIQLIVLSSRIKGQPIYFIEFDAGANFDEIVFCYLLQKRATDYLKSDEFREIQKKEYYKLRMKGVKPAEIYPQIEIRWLVMDSNEKAKFRNMLRQDFLRKRNKKV